MNTIHHLRALRAIKPTHTPPAPPPARSFGPREIEAHVQRVVRPNPFTTEHIVREQRRKLAVALTILGSRWIGHPARRLARAAHEHRDGVVATITLALSAPAVIGHIALGWFA